MNSIFPEDNINDKEWNNKEILNISGNKVYIKYNIISNDIKDYALAISNMNDKLNILKNVISYKKVSLRKILKCKHKKGADILVNIGDDFPITIENKNIIFKKNSMLILNHNWEIKDKQVKLNNKQFNKMLKIFIHYKCLP